MPVRTTHNTTPHGGSACLCSTTASRPSLAGSALVVGLGATGAVAGDLIGSGDIRDGAGAPRRPHSSVEDRSRTGPPTRRSTASRSGSPPSRATPLGVARGPGRMRRSTTLWGTTPVHASVDGPSSVDGRRDLSRSPASWPGDWSLARARPVSAAVTLAPHQRHLLHTFDAHSTAGATAAPSREPTTARRCGASGAGVGVASPSALVASAQPNPLPRSRCAASPRRGRSPRGGRPIVVSPLDWPRWTTSTRSST